MNIFDNRLLDECEQHTYGSTSFNRKNTYRAHFEALDMNGFRLLNTEDYPDWRGSLWINLENNFILFRDVEFHQAFSCEDKEGNKTATLIRFYKIEKSGLIKMKQVIFGKPEHLEIPLYQMVQYANAKHYNMVVTADQYDTIVIPYNARGMLSNCEFQCLKHAYANAGKHCLSGDYSKAIIQRRKYLRRIFLETTGEEMTNFFTYTLDCWKPIYHKPIEYICDNTYIKENTYYD